MTGPVGRRKRKKRAGVPLGARLDLDVTGVAPGGFGLADYGGERIFLSRGLPGDRVLAQVVRKERGRVEARVERVLAEGTPRIEPRCAHFGVCGGCMWQNVGYSDQLRLKREMVVFSLRESGLDADLVDEVIGSEKTHQYRNKMDFAFGRTGKDELALGLFESPSKTGRTARRGEMPPVFDVETCWLQSEASNRMVGAVRVGLREAGFQAFQPSTRSGTLRSLVIREGTKTGERLANLRVASECGDSLVGLAASLCEGEGGAAGVVLSVNPKRSKNATPESQRVLAGRECIEERLSGLTLEVSSTAFLQINTRQAERLYEVVLNSAGLEDSERALDLYCGTGILSMLLARQARDVTGVEMNTQAVEDARRNVKRNGVQNCRFICGDVLDVLPAIVGGPHRYSVIVANPPRAGLYRRVVEAVCAARPRRVVYVSCNPQTLARDLSGFQDGGYRPQRVQPVDLFPHTPHCDAVAVLDPVSNPS